MPDHPADDTDDATREVSTALNEVLETTQASSTYKVLGEIDAPDGTGVLGHNTATSGTAYGLEGVTDSPHASAAGLRGRAPNGGRGVHATASTGIGVLSHSDDGPGVQASSDTNYAGFFSTGDGGVAGLRALNVATSNPESTGYGVQASTDAVGSGAAGVYGEATQESGQTYGVRGISNSPDGYGLSTPDDARVDGILEVNNIVESSSGNNLVLRNDGGIRALLLGDDGTDDFDNTSGPNVIGGHSSNTATDGAIGVTIGGGGSSGSDRNNTVADHYGTVAGGEVNTAGNPGVDNDPTTAKWATVGGGIGNTAEGQSATVAGGGINTATAQEATVGGGDGNDATELGATVSGGTSNTAEGSRATVGGGDSNTANGSRATVGGGADNEALANSATVPGGRENTASGNVSFAAGYRANATDDGSFVWNGSENAFNVGSPAPYTFSVQADNGIWFGTDYSPSIGSGRFIDTSTGAYLSDGGTWTDSCSVTVKEDFAPAEGPDVLEKVESLDVRTWSYEDDETEARHMGPTAEDFYATFELGDDEKHIAPLDTAGVSLAAIQGLSENLKEAREQIAVKDERIEQLEGETTDLRSENEQLRERLTALEDQVAELASDASGTAPADD